MYMLLYILVLLQNFCLLKCLSARIMGAMLLYVWMLVVDGRTSRPWGEVPLAHEVPHGREEWLSEPVSFFSRARNGGSITSRVWGLTVSLLCQPVSFLDLASGAPYGCELSPWGSSSYPWSFSYIHFNFFQLKHVHNFEGHLSNCINKKPSSNLKFHSFLVCRRPPISLSFHFHSLYIT